MFTGGGDESNWLISQTAARQRDHFAISSAVDDRDIARLRDLCSPADGGKRCSSGSGMRIIALWCHVVLHGHRKAAAEEGQQQEARYQAMLG